MPSPEKASVGIPFSRFLLYDRICEKIINKVMKEYMGGQRKWLPPDLGTVINADDPVRLLREVAEKMDYQELYRRMNANKR